MQVKSFILAACAGGFAHAAVPATPISVAPDTIACKHFIGFGAEWDSPGYVTQGVTDAEFARVAARVAWMRLPVARVMMLTRWCYLGEGKFSWETPAMKALYRDLDVCQKLGTTVILTDWGAERDWTKPPSITAVDQDEYAQAIGTYMEYLLRTKGYTCIRYFVLTNEPNGEVGDFGRWRRGVEKVAAVLTKRKLEHAVTFMGSDTYDPALWHPQAVDQLHHILGAYDIHHYASAAEVRHGALEPWWRGHWNYVRDHDPAAAGKPLMVGEAGLSDDSEPPRGNRQIGDYAYGVFMADYAVQAARAGSAAVSAWMLDDTSLDGFFWGLWDNKKNGFALRPWFYPWSLLARYFPTGALTYAPPQTSGDLRVLAARIPSGRPATPDGWSVCLVNRADNPCQVALTLPAAPTLTLKRYVYSQADSPHDADGLPVPSASMVLGSGAAVSCPANSVVILTSLP